MTPTFSRIWFVKMQTVLARFRLPASLRSACDISRAWRPTVWSPICALELGARRERRDRVDRDHVDRAGADQHVGDLERLLAVVGLRHEQLVDVDADRARVDGIDRVLGVDERADAAHLLGLGDDLVDERRLTRGLGAEDLDDPPARHAADAEREVDRQRAGRDRRHRHDGRVVAEAHQRIPGRTRARSASTAAFSAAPLAEPAALAVRLGLAVRLRVGRLGGLRLVLLRSFHRCLPNRLNHWLTISCCDRGKLRVASDGTRQARKAASAGTTPGTRENSESSVCATSYGTNTPCCANSVLPPGRGEAVGPAVVDLDLAELPDRALALGHRCPA